MKTYLLAIFALLIAGCGIYFWTSSLSEKERLELLNGTFELVDWRIRPGPQLTGSDSITLHRLPLLGECLTVQAKDIGQFRLMTESSSPIVRQLADLDMSQLYVRRPWFARNHRVEGVYSAKKDGYSVRVSWYRTWFCQKYACVVLYCPDPTNQQIGWTLVFMNK